jgi:hypothetical protein
MGVIVMKTTVMALVYRYFALGERGNGCQKINLTTIIPSNSNYGRGGSGEPGSWL